MPSIQMYSDTIHMSPDYRDHLHSISASFICRLGERSTATRSTALAQSMTLRCTFIPSLSPYLRHPRQPWPAHTRAASFLCDWLAKRGTATGCHKRGVRPLSPDLCVGYFVFIKFTPQTLSLMDMFTIAINMSVTSGVAYPRGLAHR